MLKQLVEELHRQTHYHNGRYYQGKPEITDLVFDRMYDLLVKIEQSNPDLCSKTSPTHSVGE